MKMRPGTRVGVLTIAIVVISLLTRIEVDCKPAAAAENEDLKSEDEPEVETGAEEAEAGVEAKDLKYTFANEDEIPDGFKVQERRIPTPIKFNACRDVSGGICVPVGQCSQNLKPETKNVNACDAGEECCLGGPPKGTPCKNRGGECIEASKCGRNPAQLKSRTECNHDGGETCCIWLY